MPGPVRLFAAELRQRRQAAGLSLAELAAAVHYSKGYLSRIETGMRPASQDLARRCDDVLGAGGRLSALASRSRPAASSDPGCSEDEVTGVTWPGRDGRGCLTALTRCQALTSEEISLPTWGLRQPPERRGADGGSAVFLAIFERFRELGRVASPAIVLPAMISQTQMLRSLARGTAGRRQQDIALLAGRHAEFTGWMFQEAGDDRAALWWTDLAIELAGAACDRDLSSYALVRRAGVLLYRGDSGQVIELAQQAQQDPRSAARTRSLAARREAQGHALAGDAAACLRALDRSAELLAAVADVSALPPLGSTAPLDQHALATAWCLYDLGRPRQSAELLDQLLSAATVSRASLRFEARRALAHAAARDVDAACQLAHRILDEVATVDSATIRQDLRSLGRVLGRWHAHPAVREIGPALAAACRDPG
jgi:Helix-turn-helix domain